MYRLLVIIILFTSCMTVKNAEKASIMIRHDSIVKIDTLYKEYQIKGDTVFKTDTLINIDTVIKYKTINIDTLKVKGNYASCESGIVRNRPFLNLFEKDIKLKVEQYNKTIKIKDSIIIEKSIEIEKIKNISIFANRWFWICIVMCLLIIIYFLSRAKHLT